MNDQHDDSRGRVSEGMIKKGGVNPQGSTVPRPSPPKGSSAGASQQSSDDGGPVHPEPFIYMVNSMADRQQLREMAREFADRIKEMPKGLTVRDWLVGQALAGTAGVRGVGGKDAYYIHARCYVDRAETIADEYLRRRKERHDQ